MFIHAVANVPVGSDVLHPGVAKSRLAQSREMNINKRGNHVGGWHESIQAAAASANREWESRSGFPDYNPSPQLMVASQFEEGGEDISGPQNMHLELTTKVPPSRSSSPQVVASPNNGEQLELSRIISPTTSLHNTINETAESKVGAIDPALADLIPKSLLSEEDLLLETISRKSGQVRRSIPRRRTHDDAADVVSSKGLPGRWI